MPTYLILLCLAYLLGAIPFGFLLVRLVRKEDIRSKGSGNIGATNVLRSGAKGLGALTFLLDAGKGYAAVALASLLAAGSIADQAVNAQNVAVLAGLAAVVGHIFPVWLRFKGGKGVATAFGVFLALSPWAALASLGVFAVVFLLSRYVSLASILGAAALPVLTLLVPTPGAHTALFKAVAFACPALVIARHWRNIGRLIRGTEYRFGRPKPAGA